MSRKTQRSRPDPGPVADRSAAEDARGARLLLVAVVAALVVVAVVALVYGARQAQGPSPAVDSAPGADSVRAAALASAHSMSLGEPDARVHVVEFLDPACETCALFFPIVKRHLAENPGKIRLSVRHVAFHAGSEYAVRVLEASRAQGRYWQTLEALLGSQSSWAPNHTVRPELVDRAIAGVGLDLQRLAADMRAPEIAQRMEQDMRDAAALRVAATPEYFVNGRGLPDFGEAPLRALIDEEVRRAYP